MNQAIIPVSPHNTVGRHPPRPEPTGVEPADGIELADLWRALRRRWLSIGITGAVVSAILLAVALTQPERYTAIATVGIRATQSNVLDAPRSNVRDQALDSAAIDTELEVMRSSRVIEALTAELDEIGHPQWEATKASFEAPASPEAATDIASSADGETQNNASVRWVADAVQIRRAGLTYAVEIVATAHNAEFGALLANSFYDVYARVRSSIRQEEAQNRNAWLSDRINVLRDDVLEREAAVDHYRSSAGLLSAAGGSLTEQVLAETQSSVADARADLAAKQARLDQVKSEVSGSANSTALTNVLNSPLIRDLRSRSADLARRKAELDETYGERHPSMRAVIAEQRQIRNEIQGEVDRIVSNLEGEVQIAELRLQMLNEQLNEARNRVLDNNQAEVRLRDLEREASAAREVYERYLERYRLAVDEGQLFDSGVYLISPARAPKNPSWPNTTLALALALGIGGIAGLGVAGVLELRDNTFRSVDEVERLSNYACIAALPHLSRRKLKKLPEGSERSPAGFMMENPLSAYAESVRLLHSTLTNSQFPISVLAVTSALPNEGKTSTSLSLARCAAGAGQSVLLMDCDERRRGVSQHFAEDYDGPGLRGVITGDISVADAVLKDPRGSSVTILPFNMSDRVGLDSKDNHISFFSAERFEALLSKLKEDYDLVILDCAPILAIAETRNLVRLAQATLMVGRCRETPMRAVQSALRQVESAGGSIYGLVLNGVGMGSAGSLSFSDPLYYKESMKHYYTS